MAMLCALDWRHYGVIATLTPDAAGGARLVLSHGADEVVVHLSWASLDALTYAGLQCPRPNGGRAVGPLAPELPLIGRDAERDAAPRERRARAPHAPGRADRGGEDAPPAARGPGAAGGDLRPAPPADPAGPPRALRGAPRPRPARPRGRRRRRRRPGPSAPGSSAASRSASSPRSPSRASARARRCSILDQLEAATPAMAPVIEACLDAAVVLGATRDCRPGLQKLWWAFERLDLPPLARDDAKTLLWTLVDRDRIPDAPLFEATVLEQAAGNPHAIVDMARQVAGEGPVALEAIRALQHGAGLRYLDLTPVLLLVAAGARRHALRRARPRRPGPLHPGRDARRALLRGPRPAHAAGLT